MPKSAIAAALSCAVVFALPGHTIEARAGLVIANLTAPSTGQFGASNPDTMTRFGSTFALNGSFAPVGLNTVILRLASNNGIIAHAWLYSDSSTLPGNVLVDLGTAPVSGGGISNFADYSFAPLSPLTLQPSMSYWLVVGETDPTATLYWAAVNSLAIDQGSDPAASLPPTFAISFNSGGTWSRNGNLPCKFAVYANNVPEPATVGLLALGAMNVLRRLRARRMR